ncbi:OmpA family protein [Shewanella glacialipiscicola]|uniref:Porin n=2 Tax=Shewanella glacialipiscicola TaxID=614069 RepID=A0ABQ6J4L5_9GAMM|nr:OmpA family protein [Shewanella glacialipiscicola]MCL1087614.1 outer membrane beta-barrel protein [Shewanella glacialipiscicola]GIU16055.1 porin [Shewanella glacialipiscicola]GMA83063.1 porin [Shewanella glacialipiscicola]
MDLNKMMKNTLKIVLLTSMLPFAASASQELTPWYVGAGLGVNNYEHVATQNGSDDSFAWDIFAGYMFNDYFGAEIGFRDLGNADWTAAGISNDADVKGTTLGLVGLWPLANRWSLSAEAGAMYYTLENSQNNGLISSTYSTDDFAPYFGAGVGYNFTDNLKLQAKYRRYENLNDDYNIVEADSNYWGLELSYRFGNTVAAAPVAAPVVAAPVDSDNDGVYDDKDQCPATPATHKVDSVGCTIYENVKNKEDVGSIQFANDSAVVKNVYYKDIERLANYMNKNPEFTVEIAGHASNVGKPDYNMELSHKRANAVADILVNKYGISQSRVTAKGYGVNQPLVAGDSKEAHAANRRIEAIVTTTTKQPVLK